MGGFLLLLLLSNAAFSAPFELVVAPVTDQVYAIVGEIGPRRAENHGLNNTLGFVVTRSGVVLIGSGATPAGAQLIEEAVAQVTEQPIQLVV
ncbi:MAG: MBL fold metallo-hydrolase, partial [Gammaproteobacteria bacterium]|nr:MBL fold metallo-hydrolase [Gammaproteobacteria bacterium]